MISLFVVASTKVAFNVTLPEPGTKIVYDLVVQNEGTIDAVFKSIEGVEAINSAEPTQIVYTVDRLDAEGGNVVTGEGDLVNTTGKNYFRVTVEWPASSDTVPTGTSSKTGTILLNYEQKAA